MRVSSGTSQVALAERLGKPQSFVSKAETGERRLDLIEALLICDALDGALIDLIPPSLAHLMREPRREREPDH